MTTCTVERDVAAPIERVWRVYTDLDQAHEHRSAVTKVEKLTDAPLGEGVTWRETRIVFGQETTEKLTISAWEPPRRYVIEADGSGIHYATEFVFDAIDEEHTHVRSTFQASPTSLVAKIFNGLLGTMLMGSVEKALRQDLDDLAAVAET